MAMKGNKLDRSFICNVHGKHIPVAEIHLDKGCQYSICRWCGENVKHNKDGAWVIIERKNDKQKEG